MDLVHLTRKQREFFDYIVEYKKENDIWPTYREIADHFGFRSPNSVTQNIQALLKKGFLIKSLIHKNLHSFIKSFFCKATFFSLNPGYLKTSLDSKYKCFL